MGFRLVALLKNRSGRVCSMPLRVQGSFVSWANRSIGVLSCPTPPRRPAVRRPDPTRPWYVRVLDSTGTDSKATVHWSAASNEERPSPCNYTARGSPLACSAIPGHAFHQKGLKRQEGVGPLSRSQERSTRASPAHHPLVNHVWCTTISRRCLA